MTAGSRTLPLSLYVHIPWCLKKCPYCDFNSHTFADSFPESEYVDALLMDLAEDCVYANDRVLESIFFGGGTPSLLSPTAVNRLLSGCRELFTFSPNIEISLEANPGAVDSAKFNEYRALGVNRLSLGIQSFADEQLNGLGRIHDSRQARQAIETAKRAGYENLNLDLMHGLPGQDEVAALKDLEIALSYDVPHLSWYQLTIEPNTRFHSQPPELPLENDLWSIQQSGASYLNDHLTQYEISAFSQPDYQCQHNLNYWSFGDYIGIGAGAHGKSTLPGFTQVIRTAKTRIPAHYIRRSGDRANSLRPTRTFGSVRQVRPDELPLEFMMNCLRLKAGQPEAMFKARTGLPLSVVADFLTTNKGKGLLHEGPVIQATEKGYRFLNSLLEELI